MAEFEDADLEGVVEVGVEVFDCASEVLGDLVDDEHEPERAGAQVLGDLGAERVGVELLVVGGGAGEVGQGCVLAGPHDRVEVVVAQPPQAAGGAEELTDDRTADLGVAVELGLHEGDRAVGLNQEHVYGACGGKSELTQRDDGGGCADDLG